MHYSLTRGIIVVARTLLCLEGLCRADLAEVACGDLLLIEVGALLLSIHTLRHPSRVIIALIACHSIA